MQSGQRGNCQQKKSTTHKQQILADIGKQSAMWPTGVVKNQHAVCELWQAAASDSEVHISDTSCAIQNKCSDAVLKGWGTLHTYVHYDQYSP